MKNISIGTRVSSIILAMLLLSFFIPEELFLENELMSWFPGLWRGMLIIVSLSIALAIESAKTGLSPE